jgi:hypothetical protein
VSVKRVRGLIDYRFSFLLTGVHRVLDLALRVLDLLLGLAAVALCLTLGLKILVAGNDSRGLLGFAGHLIRLRTYREHLP